MNNFLYKNKITNIHILLQSTSSPYPFREIATGYPWMRHWLPMTLATHVGYLFHFLCNIMYSSKHTIKFRLFPTVTVGTGRARIMSEDVIPVFEDLIGASISNIISCIISTLFTKPSGPFRTIIFAYKFRFINCCAYKRTFRMR